MSDSPIPSFLVSNVSELLTWLTKNEQMSESLIFSKKTSDWLRKPMSEFPALHKSVMNERKSIVSERRNTLKPRYGRISIP